VKKAKLSELETMKRPRVTIHNAFSVDGRLDGFSHDLQLFYGCAAKLTHQAVLIGSGTIVAAAKRMGVDLQGQETTLSLSPEERLNLPWWVIVDSGGKVTRFDWLRSLPHLRDIIVLCAHSTSPAHLDWLRSRGIRHHVVGVQRVDLAAALTLLAENYGVHGVRVDAGPVLNGALLRARLVDGLSVLVAPHLVGDGGHMPLRLAAGTFDDESVPLLLNAVEQISNGYVWLRYSVNLPSTV
jgi:2,5-diamino-6-(ribosylamino)-4(3H)-pyrimidinone 5'-phosphate reductase